MTHNIHNIYGLDPNVDLKRDRIVGVVLSMDLPLSLPSEIHRARREYEKAVARLNAEREGKK